MMNVCLTSNFTRCAKLFGNLLTGGKNIVLTVPAVNYCTAKGGGIVLEANHCETTKGTNGKGTSPSTQDVLRSWTKSIISETPDDNSVTKAGVVKRPDITTFKKTGDSVAGPSIGSPKFRRRLSDNSWTTLPMDEKIIWVDCEMTGLDPRVDKLIEIGVIITDGELNVIATQDSIVFHAEDSILDAMDPWCIKHHGESGLIEACRNSKVTTESADEDLLKFLQKYTTAKECPMAGNSIGQDRGFIRYQLPKFYSHFHYRDIDVSSIKEITRRWFPEAFAAAPRKKQAHRVLDDIRESIEELKYYRSTVFTSRNNAAAKVASIKNR